MTPGSVARRYGRALFELARDAGAIGPVGEQLSVVVAAVSNLEPGVLAPGLLTLQQRLQIASALGPLFEQGSLLARFLGVLAEADRLDQLPAIEQTYQRLEDDEAGRVRARICSASPLSDSEIASVREKFELVTGRRVVPELEVDDRLIGGVTVETEGRVYDGSIRTQLALLERRMAGDA